MPFNIQFRGKRFVYFTGEAELLIVEVRSDNNSNTAFFFKFKLHPGMNKRFKALLSRYFCIAEFLMKALRRPRRRWESGTFELVTVSLCDVNDFSVIFIERKKSHTNIARER